MNKRFAAGIALALSVGGIVLSTVAVPVSGETAKLAVSNWLDLRPQLGCRLGSAPTSVTSCSVDGAEFHVVSLAGGGFVVTSADTEIEPIIAFSESEEFVESEESPLWVMLVGDLSRRTLRRTVMATKSSAGSALMAVCAVSDPEEKWASLTHPRAVTTATGTGNASGGLLRAVQYDSGRTSVSDLRVAPLLKTKWSQEQDSFYSNRGDPCYNYYTPNNYPCGCVATAGAQIMKYHRYPTGSVQVRQYSCQVETGKDWIDDQYYYPVYSKVVLAMQGGTYAWDSMPDIPANGTTLGQRQAIGKLTSDIGIAALTAYGEAGGRASGYMLMKVLTDDFGYANAVAAQYQVDCLGATLRSALIPNLDAKLPVVVSLGDGVTGHAAVADGYGYSMDTLYVHFNLGWAGLNDAWYAPPSVEDYTAIDGFVCNIYPQGAAKGVICSGRVLDAGGSPVKGAVVKANGSQGAVTGCTTDDNGIYALILTPGTHTLTATKAGASAKLQVRLSANVSIELTGDGRYYASPVPSISNLYGQDLVLDGTGGGDDPGPDKPSDPVVDPTQVVFDVSVLTDRVFAVGVIGDGTGIPMSIEPLSSVKSVKATKLPSGMKIAKDKKTGLWMLTGAPKKAGVYKVTITIATTYGKKQTVEFEMPVSALPTWATGTFGGMIGRFIGDERNDDFRPYGMIDMKIATAGKITAKVVAGGKTYSLSANGFESVEVRDGYRYYRFAMTTKKGEVYEGEIGEPWMDVATMLAGEVDCNPDGQFVVKGHEPFRAFVWRNEHGKDGHLGEDKSGRAKKVMDAIKALKKVNLSDYEPAYGSAVLTIGKNGATSLSGKTADGIKLSGKSFLMLDDDGYHVIADMVVYDKKSGKVYDITPCWQPIFDDAGNIASWDEECCDHSLRVYPFE